MILLTPGPANTTQAVKDALLVGDVCHRERPFVELLLGIRRDLLRLLDAEETHDVVLFTGSGTCAVDAMVSSSVPPDGRLLVVNNGSYGTRILRMAEAYGLPVASMDLPWHEAPGPGELAARLEGVTHLAIVHHETSTGLLNPLDEVRGLCAERGVTLLVDAISSFGGIPVPAADVLCASANKCLQGLPGLSFVFARRDLLERMKTYPRRSFYTSLAEEHAAVARSGQMRFTPAVQVAYALRRALDETFEETLDGRMRRYRANWKALTEGMREQGFERLLPDALESGLLTSFLKPAVPGYDFGRHHDLLLEAGFTIYPAMVGYEHTFRLGNIGQIGTEEIRAFLRANAGALTAMGVRPPFHP